MRTGILIVMLSASVWSSAPLAQPVDAVSGTWGVPGQPWFELKFDGKRGVSGTAVFRPEMKHFPIRTGTFDPETGTLRLEWEFPQVDGGNRSYLLEAKVEGDKMICRLNGSASTVTINRLTQEQAAQKVWSRFFSGPDSVPGDEFVAAVNLADKNAKATGTLFMASSVRRVRAVIVLTERGPRTPMTAQSRFGDMNWRKMSERCACALLHFRLDTIRPVPELTLAYDVLRNAGIGGGDALVGLMERLSKETAHPELSSAPFVFWGWSAASNFGPSFAQLHPARTLAFIAYHGALPNVDSYMSVLKRIPALLLNGARDTTSGTTAAERRWAAARADDAPWTFAIEPDAEHADEKALMASQTLILPWIVAVVEKRAGKDAATLRDIDLSTGWRVDHQTGAMQLYSRSQDIQPLSSWLPDEESARAWQMVSGKK